MTIYIKFNRQVERRGATCDVPTVTELKDFQPHVNFDESFGSRVTITHDDLDTGQSDIVVSHFDNEQTFARLVVTELVVDLPFNALLALTQAVQQTGNRLQGRVLDLAPEGVEEIKRVDLPKLAMG